MAIEPIKGFYVHDEVTDTDGVARYDYGGLENAPMTDDVSIIDFTSGQNIKLAYAIGETVSLTPETVPTYSCAIVDASEGDYFTLNCTGGGNPRAWGFLDSDNKLLSVASSGVTCTDTVLIAPANSSKLVINSITSSLGRCTKGRYAIDVLEENFPPIKDAVDQYLTDTEYQFINGYNIKLAYDIGTQIDLTPSSVNVYRYVIVDCSENDLFVITARGGENPRVWGFVDSNNILLAVAPSNTASVVQTNLELVAPRNASKLIVNSSMNGSKIIKKSALATLKQVVDDADYTEISSKVANLENNIETETLQTIGEDVLLSVINGKKWADELSTNTITNFAKDGDLMVHVGTLAIVNDSYYVTYYANRTSASETPSQHIARFAYCSRSDVENKTYIDLQNIGDTFDGKTVNEIYDTILMRKDDATLYLMWTASLNGEYCRLYRTFDIATGTLGEVNYNYFKCGNTTNVFSINGVTNALAENSIEHKPLTIDIGIMQKLSSRVENGVTYYYTGCYANLFNCIIKSSDLITWEFVALPDFPNDMQFENAVYVIGDIVFYFARQEWKHNTGVLCTYNLNTKEWSQPVYVNDCQSRSDFFYHDGELYLIHAPKDRQHVGIVKINTTYISQSAEVQVAYNSSMFYPFVLPQADAMYMVYTNSRRRIYLTKFTTLGEQNSVTKQQMYTKIKELFIS